VKYSSYLGGRIKRTLIKKKKVRVNALIPGHQQCPGIFAQAITPGCWLCKHKRSSSICSQLVFTFLFFSVFCFFGGGSGEPTEDIKLAFQTVYKNYKSKKDILFRRDINFLVALEFFSFRPSNFSCMFSGYG